MKTVQFLENIQRVGLISLCCFVLSSGVGAAPGDWQPVRQEGDLQLESRHLEGERFPEFRVQTMTGVSPERLEAFLINGDLDQAGDTVVRRVTKRLPHLVEWTDLVKTAVASDRCSTLRATTAAPGADGERVVTVKSNEEWPVGKPSPDCVVMRIRCTWAMVPVKGQTQLTYTMFTDVGGSAPVFLVRGTLENDIFKRVKRVLIEAAK